MQTSVTHLVFEYYAKLSVLEHCKKENLWLTPLCYAKQYFVMQESIAFLQRGKTEQLICLLFI